MSHIQCSKCGGREHYQLYGMIPGGGIGGYTICECGEVLERSPELDEDGEPITGKCFHAVMDKQENGGDGC